MAPWWPAPGQAVGPLVVDCYLVSQPARKAGKDCLEVQDNSPLCSEPHASQQVVVRQRTYHRAENWASEAKGLHCSNLFSLELFSPLGPGERARWSMWNMKKARQNFKIKQERHDDNTNYESVRHIDSLGPSCNSSCEIMKNLKNHGGRWWGGVKVSKSIY